MANGGARAGAGRKPKSDEARIQAIAAKAMIKKFGSEQRAFEYLLNSKEPSLIKFAFEHAFGKPREKVDMNNGGQITLKVIRGSKPAT